MRSDTQANSEKRVLAVDFRAMMLIPVKFVCALAVVYTVIMAGYIILRLLGGGALAPVFLLNYLIPPVLLPSIILLPLFSVRRSWAFAAMLAINVAVLLGLFGWMLRPKTQAAAPEGAAIIKVMTYNLASYNGQPDPVIDTLRGSGADIIGLQELDTIYVDAINRDLADLYPYRVVESSDHVIYGKGLISRYPILDFEAHSVESDRIILEALVDVGGSQVQVFSFHPPPPALFNKPPYLGEHPDADGEFTTLLNHIKPDLPVLVLCDCNITDQHPRYEMLRNAGFRDAFRVVGRGFGLTFPADDGLMGMLPALVRIDFIWISDDFIPLEANVGDGHGSDHFPVIAELALP